MTETTTISQGNRTYWVGLALFLIGGDPPSRGNQTLWVFDCSWLGNHRAGDFGDSL